MLVNVGFPCSSFLLTDALHLNAGSRCQKEFDDYHQVFVTDPAYNDETAMKNLKSIQCNLVELGNSLKDAISTDEEPSLQLEDIEAYARDQPYELYPDGDVPPGFFPVPQLLGIISQAFLQRNEHQKALKFSLKSCLSFQRRLGPEWVHTLFATTQMLVRAIVVEQAQPRSIFPTGMGIWDIFHGYLSEVNSEAQLVYGRDTLYAKAIANWFEGALASSNPRIGSAKHVQNFASGQRKLLQWIEIPETMGIVFPRLLQL